MWKSTYKPTEKLKLGGSFCKTLVQVGMELLRNACTMLWNDGGKEDKRTTLHLLYIRQMYMYGSHLVW